MYMAEFISTFLTGFQDVVAEDIKEKLKNCKILNVYDGLIHYKYDGNSRDLEKITYFNNTFFVLKTMKGKGLNFASLIGAVSSENKYYLINKGTFRVRFVMENQFAKLDKNLVRKAEECVLRNSKLALDRLSPSTEIWYSIRRENFAFCGQLITKREFTEKNLHKGELRPELAYLICSYAKIKSDDVVLEPFCGYGSIPVQLSKHFQFKKMYINDIDEEKIALLKENKHLKKENIEISVKDSLKSKNFPENEISLVISDPPWGFYEDIGDISTFYETFLTSIKATLLENARIILLSARGEELKLVAEKQNIKIQEGPHTLVNGKKACVFTLQF